MSQKTWDDNALFYGGEALILLVAEGYIVYTTYNGPKSLPFCFGLLLTALVAGIGMHWALTKLSRKLVGGGYAVWLVITALVCFTAGVLWMAADRRQDHEKALIEQAAKRNAEAQRETEAKTRDAQTQLASNLTTLTGLQPLLAQAKTQLERKRILEMAKGMIAAQATPTPDIATQVAVAIAQPKAKPETIAPIEDWQPFEKESFFDFWYHSMTRFCSMIGLFGLALLLGLFILYRNEETALRHAQATSRTTTTVTTAAAQHNPPSQQTLANVTANGQHSIEGFGRGLPGSARQARTRAYVPSQQIGQDPNSTPRP